MIAGVLRAEGQCSSLLVRRASICHSPSRIVKKYVVAHLTFLAVFGKSGRTVVKAVTVAAGVVVVVEDNVVVDLNSSADKQSSA